METIVCVHLLSTHIIRQETVVSVGLTISNLSYVIKTRTCFGTTKKLLNNVTLDLKPGTLTALMGASGAGKTTLLDILAKRNKTGTITGTILVNGVPIKKCASFKRIAGYVFQDDKLMATLTVKESLMFAAGMFASIYNYN